MGGWGKLNFAQKKCVSSAGFLMQNTGMLWPGARIGVAASGGSDSFVLSQVMLIRRAIMPFPVELMILHVNPGFEPDSHVPLARWAEKNGLAAHLEVTDHGLEAHSEKNRKKSPCFLCSWKRRKRLFELCDTYNLTHLALGHNADDMESTFFMNLFQNGRVEGLSPNESFFQGRLRLIRPLLFVEKKLINAAARKWQLPVWKNPCPSSGLTRRDDVSSWLAEIYGKNRNGRRSVLGGLERFTLDAVTKKP